MKVINRNGYEQWHLSCVNFLECISIANGKRQHSKIVACGTLCASVDNTVLRVGYCYGGIYGCVGAWLTSSLV